MDNFHSNLNRRDFLRVLTAGGAWLAAPLPCDAREVPAVPSNAPHPAPSAPQNLIYVSPQGDDGGRGDQRAPFRTLERARDAARLLLARKKGDVIVLLRGGRYPLERALQLDARDGGRDGVSAVWRAFRGETPILCGGRILRGWTPLGNGQFQAQAGELRFRQLYVGSARAQRSRQGYFRLLEWGERDERARVKVRREDAARVMESFEAQGGLEFHVLRHWAPAILRVAGFETEGENVWVDFLQPDAARMRIKLHDAPILQKSGQAFSWQGARALLDSPSQWWQNPQSGAVIYQPRQGERMDQVEIFAPDLETLISIEGTATEPVRDLRFEGLTLQHTGWTAPSREGSITLQAVRYAMPAERAPAALQVRHAERLRVTGCTLRHLGSDGIALLGDTKGCEIVGNTLDDIAGTGIAVGGIKGKRFGPIHLSSNDVVAHNVVSSIGQDFAGAVGIFGGYCAGLHIEHNEVSHTPYTAISVGWGWTDQETGLRDNLIARNHIHHVVQLLDDGAGIYTLSRQPGTRIVENYIHDIERSAWAGRFPIAAIYLDNGSSLMHVENNVIERVKDDPQAGDRGRVFQQTLGIPASNNTLINNQSDSQWVKDNAGPRLTNAPTTLSTPASLAVTKGTTFSNQS